VFLTAILTMFILPWNSYRYTTTISEPNPRTLRKYTITLFMINGISLIVFMAIFYLVHPEVSNYENFKNDGTAVDAIRDTNINHFLLLFSIYLHPTAYFLIPLHFFYLKNKKYFLSLIAFLLSLNIAFFSLTVFSRSGIIEYMMLYLFYFPFFYNEFKERIRYIVRNRLFLIFAFAAAAGFAYLIIFFYQITANRFENAVVEPNSFIDNPVIYYLFDYASQWLENSNEVMSTYSFHTLNGELSFPLLYAIAHKLQLFQYPEGILADKLYVLWGKHFNTFNGLTANLLFDYGYIGTLIYSCFYFILVWLLRPVRGRLSFDSFLGLGIFFILPAMGIFNYQMRSLVYNALIVYYAIACLWVFFYKNIVCSVSAVRN